MVTVGTGGDKMFWGRLAARLAGVPVICSALHSTGLPDHVELPNRLLAPITDAFIAVAEPHAEYLAEHEGCPAAKVRVIPNGVDVEQFRRRWPDRGHLRRQLGIPEGTPVAAIVAALRPEKNHELFLEAAARIRQRVPGAHVPGRRRRPPPRGAGAAGRRTGAGRLGAFPRHPQRRGRVAGRWSTCWC